MSKSKKQNVEEHADPEKFTPGPFSRETVNNENEKDPSTAGRYQRAVERARKEAALLDDLDAPAMRPILPSALQGDE